MFFLSTTEFYLHPLTDLPVSPNCWFLIFPTVSFLECILSTNIHITQPCSCSHAFWKEDWPWGINRTPWGANPVHMRQDRESSIPLPPFKNSQDPQGISHRDRTGRDRTGQDSIAEPQESYTDAQADHLADFLILAHHLQRWELPCNTELWSSRLSWALLFLLFKILRF